MSSDEIAAAIYSEFCQGPGLKPGVFVKAVQRKFSFDDQLLLHLFQILDFSNDGKLQLNEFKHFFYVIMNGPYANNTEVYFHLSDMDKNQFIDKKEFQRIAKIMLFNLNENRMDKMLSFYGDGEKLNVQQFVDCWNQLSSENE